MRTVTMKELDALLAAVGRVRVKMAELSAACIATDAIMNANPSDGAQPFGAKRAIAIKDEADQVFQQFTRAARNFLGEGRRVGETYEAFFARVATMSEQELLATPVRNGLKLRL